MSPGFGGTGLLDDSGLLGDSDMTPPVVAADLVRPLSHLPPS
ncbi:hypothetical protein Pd630_LPD02507 [Rhodococcus opacus PD630]|nr:hypothetical protein Pd630_LPD02507 [Rhodococcus opacus PD630]